MCVSFRFILCFIFLILNALLLNLSTFNYSSKRRKISSVFLSFTSLHVLNSHDVSVCCYLYVFHNMISQLFINTFSPCVKHRRVGGEGRMFCWINCIDACDELLYIIFPFPLFRSLLITDKFMTTELFIFTSVIKRCDKAR